MKLNDVGRFLLLVAVLSFFWGVGAFLLWLFGVVH